jgi:hypothetical protein
VDDRRHPPGRPRHRLPAPEGVKVDIRTTVSTYRDYRVAPGAGGVPTARAIQSRRRATDSWAHEAGIPDPATGLARAMEYLADDLKSVREMAAPPTPAARGR